MSKPVDALPGARIAATIQVTGSVRGRCLPGFVAAGVLMTVVLTLVLARDAPLVARDPELLRLLRFMAVVKGAMVMAAVALLLWRARWPLRTTLALAYGLVCCVAAAAVASLAHGAWVGPAALAFHAAELGFLLAAWRDGRQLRPTVRP